MIRYLITLGVMVSIMSGMGWYILKQHGKLHDARSELAAVEHVLEEERKLNEKLTAEKQNYVEQIQKARADLNQLRNSDRKLFVRAQCPELPETSTNATRTEEGAAELDPASRRAYFDLRAAIVEVEGLLGLCRAELEVRSQN